MEWIALIIVGILWRVFSGRISALRERVDDLRQSLHVKDEVVRQLTQRVYELETAKRTATPAVAAPPPIEAPLIETAPEPAIPVPALVPAAVLESHSIVAGQEEAEQAALVEQPAPFSEPGEPPPALPPPRPPVDWEAKIGTSWLNAIGVLVLVVGISLLLGYTLTVLGPVGKVAIGVSVALVMLAAGVFIEGREKYAIFGRGLIAGGWATLYFTVYAMHALAAARIIESPYVAGILLLLVASGMIGHSLRYRSQTLTLSAFFTAYFALQLAPASLLAIGASVPLTIALLAICRHLNWTLIPVAGLLLTYFTFGFRYNAAELGVTGGAAALYCYWICFEIHDLLRLREAGERGPEEHSLFPLNIFMLFGVSAMTLPPSTPLNASNFLASLSILMVGSAVLRMRWRPAEPPADLMQRILSQGHRFGVAMAAAFMVGAILRRFDGIRAEIGLLIEAQLLVGAGMRLGDRVFVRIGMLVFLAAAGHNFRFAETADKWTWAPMLLCMAALFYVNRWYTKIEQPFSYAATILLAIGVGELVPNGWFATVWIGLALTMVEVFRYTRLREFLYQAAGLGVFGVLVNMLISIEPGKVSRTTITTADAIGGALVYLSTIRMRGVADFLREYATVGGTLLSAWAIWLAFPAAMIAPAWGLLGLVLLERGVLTESRSLRFQAHAILFLSFGRVFFANLPVFTGTAGVSHRLLTVMPLIALAAYAWRRTPDALVNRAYSWAAVILAVALLRFELGRTLVSLGWACLMLALLSLGIRRDWSELRQQAYAVAAITFARGWATNFFSPDLSITERVVLALAVIAAFKIAQFLEDPGRISRTAFSLAGSLLFGLMLYHEMSGRLLTVGWAFQAVVTLMAGLLLQERVMRITGLSLFLICILKVFFHDLRELDTLGRIFSFIALGLLLMGASWLYMRFRDKIQRYL